MKTRVTSGHIAVNDLRLTTYYPRQSLFDRTELTKSSLHIVEKTGIDRNKKKALNSLMPQLVH